MTSPFRLVLRRVETTILADGNYRYAVWLAGRGEIYIGESSSDDEEENQLRAVVQATLQAVNKALRKPIDMRLLYTKQIFLSEVAKVVFLVIIQAGDIKHTRMLPGICLFSSLTAEVAAKATLNALNRTISRNA